MRTQAHASASPYARAQETGRAAVHTLILDTASTLLETSGPAALTMRRIADEVGCSTTVLYTMFGGKSGIADALWREGFARLHRALDAAAAAGTASLQRLAAVGKAYRASALANRSYYAIMFQRPIPGFEPTPDSYDAAVRPLRVLTRVVEECIGSGDFAPGDPEHIAGVLWAAVHGAVSLELAGFEGARDPEARFTDLAAAAAEHFLVRNSSPRE